MFLVLVHWWLKTVWALKACSTPRKSSNLYATYIVLQYWFNVYSLVLGFTTINSLDIHGAAVLFLVLENFHFGLSTAAFPKSKWFCYHSSIQPLNGFAICFFLFSELLQACISMPPVVVVSVFAMSVAPPTSNSVTCSSPSARWWLSTAPKTPPVAWPTTFVPRPGPTDRAQTGDFLTWRGLVVLLFSRVKNKPEAWHSWAVWFYENWNEMGVK